MRGMPSKDRDNDDGFSDRGAQLPALAVNGVIGGLYSFFAAAPGVLVFLPSVALRQPRAELSESRDVPESTGG